MSTISGIIIAKNAEQLIAACIDSLFFCNEILVVDAISTDKTVEIARQKKAIVVQGNPNDFAKQRNIGREKAKGTWLLYIDTDERVSKELAKNIQTAIQSKDYDAYALQRKNFYLGQNPWPKVERLERLFRSDALLGWKGTLHETPIVKGAIGTLGGYLLHYTHRDLSSMLDKTIQWSKMEAKLRLDAQHPKIVPWRLVRVMLTGFYDSYIAQQGWKAGTMGFIESMYQAYSMLITYAQLWEMQRK